MPFRKKILFVVTVVFSMMLTLVLCELLMISYRYFSEGRFISVQERLQADSSAGIFSVEKKGCQFVDTIYPHPYLGYVAKPHGLCQEVRRFGLLGSSDVPYKRSEEDFVVLLTGGSVAQIFSNYHDKELGNFEEYLNRQFIPPAGKKKFRVAAAAFGDWTQPQQLIATTLFAHAIDAVVSLDGFNEILSGQKRSMLGMPSPNFTLLNPHALQGYGGVVKTWISINIYKTFTGLPLLRSSQLGYFLLKKSLLFLNPEQVRASVGKSLINQYYMLPETWSLDDVTEYNLSLYRRYLVQMHDVAEKNGMLSAFFFQPVPGFHKELTGAENAALKGFSYDGYREQIASLMQLRNEGLNVVSLLKVFEPVKEDVYMDQVHYLGTDVQRTR